MRELAKKRAYCKNTVKGKQRGKKYPAEFRAEVVMAMLDSNSICAVAKKYGVPESTIRSWMSEEAGAVMPCKAGRSRAGDRHPGKPGGAGTGDLFCRAGPLRANGRRRSRRGCTGVWTRTPGPGLCRGHLLKDDPEELADATETRLVVYGGAGTRNLRLYEDERNLLNAELERYEAG